MTAVHPPHLVAALQLLFWLLVAHVVCDYPLQGDFMARAKNHAQAIAGVPSYLILASHALIHAGAVTLLTNSYAFGLLEFGAHTTIDYLKCDGRTTFGGDQALHAFCKVLFIVAALRAGWL